MTGVIGNVVNRVDTGGMDRRLRLFFFLTFGISWGIPALLALLSPWGSGRLDRLMPSVLYIVAAWGPAVAAFIMVGWCNGPDGLRRFGRHIFAWRARVRWYALTLTGIPLIYLLAAAIPWLAGKPTFSWPDTGAWGVLVLSAVGRAFAGPIEEIGWRGFALPLLQQQYSGLGASILLGFIWGIWHLPLLVNGVGIHNFVTFIAQAVAVSMIFTVIFNASAGCLPMLMLGHWLTNFPYPWEGDVELLPAQTFMLGIAAVGMLLIFGKRYLGYRNLVTGVPGFTSSLDRVTQEVRPGV